MALWRVLVILLILTGLIAAGLGTFLYLAASKKAKLQAQVRALEAQQLQNAVEHQKAAEEAKLVTARNLQNEVLTQARRATNAVMRLLSIVDQTTTLAESLKTSETGRRAALHPDLVTAARRLFESELRELPARQEIINHLEAARRIEQQVTANLGTAYNPEADWAATVQEATVWANYSLRKAEQVRALANSIAQDAAIKVTDTPLTAQSPTLTDAVAQLNQAEAALRQQIIEKATVPAKDVAADTMAKAEVERIIEEAKVDAAKLLQQVKEEAARTDQENKERIAELQRQIAMRDATNKLEDIRVQIKTDELVNEAAKLKLKQKAELPEVQGKLAPFTTPGSWFPGGKISYEKKPYSLSYLQSRGALSPTMSGLKVIAELAMDQRDRERPRLKFTGNRKWQMDPDKMAVLQETQQLLMELGSVLVEMGQLEP